MRFTLYILFLFSLSGNAIGQECDLILSGNVLDKGSNISLHFSNIYIQEAGVGTVTDSLGNFQFRNLCPGKYHLEISHIGCEPKMCYFEMDQDTVLKIYLHHHAELLDEVVVHGHREDNTSQTSATISAEVIAKEGNKNLTDLLENITGVSSLKNGSGISKPVIHGLFGNRVAILNNGVAQAGQQWGNDHAPEIDPFSANHLSVVKGASALAYPGNSLGSVVLVEAGDFEDDPHLKGNVNYIYQTNGRGHSLNGKLEQNTDWAAWRINGTFKKRGDTHAPDYFLTNTGNQETNFSAQLEKQFSTRLKSKLYYSLFNAEIGILRGSHIGNTTDLERALESEVPFFTADTFSYIINAPRQKVQHHLLKFESKYFLSENAALNFKYGGQLNNRKEFDVRRGGRTETPALHLNQYQHFFETVFNQEYRNGMLLKSGVQFNLVDNGNIPGTGILPLIPNYLSYQPSGFVILRKEAKKWFWEAGGRYDMKMYDVTAVSNTIPRVFEYFDHQYHNYAFSGGAKYKFSKSLKASLNLGHMLRAPEINELYSAGLHQGVSGIEEGSRDLTAEMSTKLVGSIDWFFRKKLFIQALGYYQQIDDFIYLQPQSEFRLTIRGAFPVFLYEQTDATIYGTDLQLTFEPTQRLKIVNKYAVVRGMDRTNDLPLINIPADNFSTAWQYNFKSSDRFKNPFLSLSGKYVRRQCRLEEGQDFAPTPDEYFLLNASIGTTVSAGHSSFDVSISGENLLNTSYRDYLNRLRYFADDLGRNVSLRVNWKFGG